MIDPLPPLVVNARFLTQRITGVQRCAIEISRRLKRMAPATRFVAPRGVIHTDIAAELGAEQVGCFTGHAWEQLELPQHLDGAGLIGLCNAGPLAVSRQVVTLCDAAPFAVPEAYGPAFRLWYRLLAPALGRRAQRIITISHFSAGELHRRMAVPMDKIVVVPLGHEHATALVPDDGVLDRHGLRDRPFVLAVGSRSPHKNFARLLGAARRLGDEAFLFVIAGGVDPRIHAATDEGELPANVRHVGAVSDGELRALYDHATGYVHPAYYEGFGLPPLEAMALGCPVIAANAAAVPEILNGAARYFDPFDEGDMARTIADFMADDAGRADLRARGLDRTVQFTWDRCAELVLDTARRAFG